MYIHIPNDAIGTNGANSGSIEKYNKDVLGNNYVFEYEYQSFATETETMRIYYTSKSDLKEKMQQQNESWPLRVEYEGQTPDSVISKLKMELAGDIKESKLVFSCDIGFMINKKSSSSGEKEVFMEDLINKIVNRIKQSYDMKKEKKKGLKKAQGSDTNDDSNNYVNFSEDNNNITTEESGFMEGYNFNSLDDIDYTYIPYILAKTQTEGTEGTVGKLFDNLFNGYLQSEDNIPDEDTSTFNFTHNGYEITVALHDNNIYITKNFYNTLADIPQSQQQSQQQSQSQPQQPTFYKIEVGKFRIIFKDIIDWDAVPSEINIKKEYNEFDFKQYNDDENLKIAQILLDYYGNEIRYNESKYGKNYEEAKKLIEEAKKLINKNSDEVKNVALQIVYDKYRVLQQVATQQVVQSNTPVDDANEPLNNSSSFTVEFGGSKKKNSTLKRKKFNYNKTKKNHVKQKGGNTLSEIKGGNTLSEIKGGNTLTEIKGGNKYNNMVGGEPTVKGFTEYWQKIIEPSNVSNIKMKEIFVETSFDFANILKYQNYSEYLWSYWDADSGDKDKQYEKMKKEDGRLMEALFKDYEKIGFIEDTTSKIESDANIDDQVIKWYDLKQTVSNWMTFGFTDTEAEPDDIIKTTIINIITKSKIINCSKFEQSPYKGFIDHLKTELGSNTREIKTDQQPKGDEITKCNFKNNEGLPTDIKQRLVNFNIPLDAFGHALLDVKSTYAAEVGQDLKDYNIDPDKVLKKKKK